MCLRIVRVYEHFIGSQLTGVFLVADPERSEAAVVRVRPYWEYLAADGRLRRDDGAHGFTRGIDEIEKMRLPAEIVSRGVQHVVGKHGDELGADAAKVLTIAGYM